MKFRKSQLVQYGVDFALCLLVGIPFLAVYLTVKPFVRGFFCNDLSIQYPYRPDTVTIAVCTGAGIGISLISFIVVEFALLAKQVRLYLEQILWMLGKICITFLVGAGLTMVLIEVGKLTIGRPRPHFLDVCRPDYSRINCSQGYIEEFTCTNTGGFSDKVLSEVRKSFPSGHSGFSAYTALFLGVYFQSRLGHLTHTYLLKVVLQLFVAIGAVYIMLSRISDYKHHWSDVLTGGILGFLVAIWTILSLGHHVGLVKCWTQNMYPSRQGSLVPASEVDVVMKRMSAMEEGTDINNDNGTTRRSNYGTTQ